MICQPQNQQLISEEHLLVWHWQRAHIHVYSLNSHSLRDYTNGKIAFTPWTFFFPEMVPNDIQSELKHLYVAVGELLRHFWSCFPVNTPFLEEKVRTSSRHSQLLWYCDLVRCYFEIGRLCWMFTMCQKLSAYIVSFKLHTSWWNEYWCPFL